MMISNQGRSISIRQTTPEDTPILYRAYTDDEFMRLYRSNNPLQSEEQLRQMLAERLKHSPEKRGYIEFIIIHRRYGAIGVASLADFSSTHRRAEMLIGLFEQKYRGGKFALEASLLVFDLAFNAYNLNKLYTYVYEYNHFAEKSTVHSGFTQEGTLKNHHYLVHEKRFVSLYINGLVIEDFRRSETLRKLSLRLLGRDITRPSEKEITAIPVDKELAAKYTAQLTKKLRTQAVRGEQSAITNLKKNSWVIRDQSAFTNRPLPLT